MTTPAVLALEDGTVFRGVSIGAHGTTTGEVVFNTAMTGYQEILTDPSYARQIVTLTYPHIGNTGTNHGDLESPEIHAAGLVIRDLPEVHSNWRATGSLTEFLMRGRGRRDRGRRHPQADPHPAREGRAVGLHRERRCRGSAPTSRSPPHVASPVSRVWTWPRSSPRGAPTSGTRVRTGPWNRAASVDRDSACTWSPTISGSSATSFGSSPTMAAGSPWYPRRPRRATC